MQRLYGYWDMQKRINDGSVWKMEGSQGRLAMDYIRDGKCTLPTKSHVDYWGNKIPSRYEVKKLTVGSMYWTINFWSGPNNYADL